MRIKNMVDLKTSIQAVVEYNWADEERDFLERGGGGGPNKSHIFHYLVALDQFINENS